VTEHEQRLGHRRREIGPAELDLKRRVVAEPLRLLVRVDVASHPGNQSRVVDNLSFGLIQAKPLGEPERDQTLAQHMFHRLAHAQVRG
jgi:hypothetical protein